MAAFLFWSLGDLHRSGMNYVHGLIPDLLLPALADITDEQLVEVKGVTLSKAHYPLVGGARTRSSAAAASHRAKI